MVINAVLSGGGVSGTTLSHIEAPTIAGVDNPITLINITDAASYSKYNAGDRVISSKIYHVYNNSLEIGTTTSASNVNVQTMLRSHSKYGSQNVAVSTALTVNIKANTNTITIE